MMFIINSMLSTTVWAQTYQNPESVTYDRKTNSYFVSNSKSGQIIKEDKQGNKSLFVTGYESFLGIKIFNDIIYSAENIKSGDDFIRGFDKSSGELVFSLPIPNTQQLNDIEIDPKGNLYVTDRKGNKIYKVNIKNKTHEVINSTIGTPNGLYFTANTLLVCNTVVNSSIYKIDLSTNQATLVIKTEYSHLDGITKDTKENIYVTSWSKDWKNSILLKYDGKSMCELLENTNGMADIEFNPTTNSISIAQYYHNSIANYHLKK